MASLDEAIRMGKAAKARGDAAGVEQARAMFKAVKASLGRSHANIAKDQESYNPTKDMSGGERFLAGMGGGFMNVGRQTAALITPESLEGPGFDKRAREGAEITDRALNETGAGMAGRFTGEMLATAPVGGAAGTAVRGGMRALTGAKQAGGLARALSYAAEGATGTSQTSDNHEGGGAMANLALTPLMNRGGRLIRALAVGSKSSRLPHAQRILAGGGDPTMGQMNPRGKMASFEGAAMQSPYGAGTVVREAQDAGLRPLVPGRAAEIAGIKPREGVSAQGGIADAHRDVARRLEDSDDILIPQRDVQELKQGRLLKSRAIRDAARPAMAEARAAQDRMRRAPLVREADAELAHARVRDLELRMTKTEDPEKLSILEQQRDAWSAKRDALVAETQAATQKAGRLRDFDVTRAGLAAGRKAAKEFVPDTLKSLRSQLRVAIKQEGLTEEAPVARMVMKYGDDVIRGRSTTQLKKAASDIRRKARDLRFSSDPNQRDFSQANVLDNVAGWFDDMLDRALTKEQAAGLRTARKQYGQLMPLEAAAFKEGSNPSGLIGGRNLERSVQEGMTQGQYILGRGGKTRQLAEDLRLIEEEMPKGALQQAGLAAWMKLPQSYIGFLGASKVGRRAAQGSYGPQKQLKATLRALDKAGVRVGNKRVRPGRLLRRSLGPLRTGVVPAAYGQNRGEE